MKNLSKTPHPYADATPDATCLPSTKRLAPPLSFPGGPEIIDTAPLRHLITALFAQIWTMFSPEKAARGTASRVYEIRRALFALYKAEKRNFCQCLLSALRADPEWQAQVRRDLGGDAAMTRWVRRGEKLANPEPKPQDMVKVPAMTALKPRNVRPASGILTDRNGLFRLAPHSRNSQKSKPVDAVRTPSLKATSLTPLSPKPIALTPNDLRPPKVKPHSSGTNTPKLDRRQIVHIWRNLQSHLLVWNYHLVMADVAINLPSLRAELTPP